MNSLLKPLPLAKLHGKIGTQHVSIYTLTNASGMSVQVSELGAHLISVKIPQKDGTLNELTLGHETFEGWCNNGPYLGSSVGRFGNRIAHGKFSLNGEHFTLATNNDPGGIPCHLHGGPDGFHKRIWKSSPMADKTAQGVKFTLTSPDGDEGYPGEVQVSITYWLNDENELSWEAEATTNKATPINIINHTYWNLSGDFNQLITDHKIQIHASHFLPTNQGMIPTGEIRSVENTPMDFNKTTCIGDGIDSDYEPIQTAVGYDHCWLIDGYDSTLRHAATLHAPNSKFNVEVFTNQPGVQFYTGNFLDGSIQGRNGNTFPPRTGLCLETQNFPDSPNHPNFPSCILKPNETYQHSLLFRFKQDDLT